MNLKERLQRAWENRSQIAEGLYNEWINSSKEVREEAGRRLDICRQNTCGYWDETGTSDKLVLKGSPGCTGCGCKGSTKTSCMTCHCYLKDIGQQPLWDALLTVEQEQDIMITTEQKKQQ